MNWSQIQFFWLIVGLRDFGFLLHLSMIEGRIFISIIPHSKKLIPVNQPRFDLIFL
jgi:hypothetical protein